MLTEIERFVNWLARRNPEARTWRDYAYDLKQFVAVVGDCLPQAVTFHDVDRFVTAQVARALKPSTCPLFASTEEGPRLKVGGQASRPALS